MKRENNLLLELNKIYNQDCLEGMKLLEDESIDLGKAGYGSYFDGLKIKFDLCDFCLCQFINSFKYNRITEHDIKNL